MRSFTFDVMRLETADGIYDRILEGADYFRMAYTLEKVGRVKLVLNRREFGGYGDSYDEGLVRYNYTVYEVPGMFAG